MLTFIESSRFVAEMTRDVPVTSNKKLSKIGITAFELTTVFALLNALSKSPLVVVIYCVLRENWEKICVD